MIEVLITAAVAMCGLIAVASMFSFAVRTNFSNRQMAVATALLYDKMEQFNSTPLGAPLWNSGDGSDSIIQDTTFMRVWHIGQGTPRAVTVIVYAEDPRSEQQTELIRATTIVGDTF